LQVPLRLQAAPSHEALQQVSFRVAALEVLPRATQRAPLHVAVQQAPLRLVVRQALLRAAVRPVEFPPAVWRQAPRPPEWAASNPEVWQLLRARLRRDVPLFPQISMRAQLPGWARLLRTRQSRARCRELRPP